MRKKSFLVAFLFGIAGCGGSSFSVPDPGKAVALRVAPAVMASMLVSLVKRPGVSDDQWQVDNSLDLEVRKTETLDDGRHGKWETRKRGAGAPDGWLIFDQRNASGDSLDYAYDFSPQGVRMTGLSHYSIYGHMRLYVRESDTIRLDYPKATFRTDIGYDVIPDGRQYLADTTLTYQDTVGTVTIKNPTQQPARLSPWVFDIDISGTPGTLQVDITHGLTDGTLSYRMSDGVYQLRWDGNGNASLLRPGSAKAEPLGNLRTLSGGRS